MSNKEDFIKELNRIKGNPIYFLETYYNTIHKDNELVLTDEEKQQLYDKFKMIPMFENTDDAFSYTDKRNELKKQGIKDWEMF